MSIIARSLFSGLYVFAGLSKLVDKWDHIGQIKQSKVDFNEFATVFPLRPFGITPEPSTFLQAVGIVELGLGVLLLGPRPVRKGAAIGLMAVMAGATQTLVCLGKYGHSVVPAICFMGLYYVFLRGKPREKRQ